MEGSGTLYMSMRLLLRSAIRPGSRLVHRHALGPIELPWRTASNRQTGKGTCHCC